MSIVERQYAEYLEYLRKRNDRTVTMDDGSIVDDATPTIEEFKYMLQFLSQHPA